MKRVFLGSGPGWHIRRMVDNDREVSERKPHRMLSEARMDPSVAGRRLPGPAAEHDGRADRAAGAGVGEAERARRRVAGGVEARDRGAVGDREHAAVGVRARAALGAQAAGEDLEARSTGRRSSGPSVADEAVVGDSSRGRSPGRRPSAAPSLKRATVASSASAGTPISRGELRRASRPARATPGRGRGATSGPSRYVARYVAVEDRARPARAGTSTTSARSSAACGRGRCSSGPRRRSAGRWPLTIRQPGRARSVRISRYIGSPSIVSPGIEPPGTTRPRSCEPSCAPAAIASRRPSPRGRRRADRREHRAAQEGLRELRVALEAARGEHDGVGVGQRPHALAGLRSRRPRPGRPRAGRRAARGRA